MESIPSRQIQAMNQTPAANRRTSALPLQLLLSLVVIAIGGLLVQVLRPRILTAYHTRMLDIAVDQQDYSLAQQHLYNLLQYPPQHYLPRLEAISPQWDQKSKTWLAGRLFLVSPSPNHGDFVSRLSPGSSSGDKREDEPLFALAMRLDPENTYGLTVLAEDAFREDDYVRAGQLSRRLVNLANRAGIPPNPEDLRRLADCMACQDRFAKAEAALMQLVQRSPLSGRTFSDMLRLANIQERLGHYRDGIRTLTDCYILLPTCEDQGFILVMRARHFALLGHVDLARKDFTAGIARVTSPSRIIDLRLRRARTFSQIGLHDEAIAELDELINMHPASIAILDTRADALFLAGRYDESYRDGREILLLDAGNPLHYNQLAWRMLIAPDEEGRRPQEALRLAKHAVQLDGKRSPAYMDTLAEAYFANKMFDDAVTTERAALNRGGELFRDSLNRFITARELSDQGETVALGISPLAGQSLPPVGDRGEPFDLQTLPALSRLTPQRASQHLRQLRAADMTPLDAGAQSLAKLWQSIPPAATDDPRAELDTFARSILNSFHPGFTQRPETNFLIGFLGVASQYAQVDTELSRMTYLMGIQPERNFDPSRRRHHAASPMEFGARTAALMLQFSSDEMTRVFTHIAEGRLRFSECLNPAYYSENASSWSDPGKLEACWDRIEERLRQAARNDTLPVLKSLPTAVRPSSEERQPALIPDFRRNPRRGLRAPPLE